MKIECFEDMAVWRDSRCLANHIYGATKKREFARDYGLRDQMRRAAVSVMSNIAEGFESRTRAMFVEFLGRSKGSAGELRSQLYLARDQQYLTAKEFQPVYEIARSCSRQIAGLIKYLESRPNTPRTGRPRPKQ